MTDSNDNATAGLAAYELAQALMHRLIISGALSADEASRAVEEAIIHLEHPGEDGRFSEEGMLAAALIRKRYPPEAGSIT